MCAELGAEYVDLLYLDTLDWSRDIADYVHVNYSGAVKLTDAVGTILREKYDLPDYREIGSPKHWEEDYEEYRALVDTIEIHPFEEE